MAESWSEIGMRRLANALGGPRSRSVSEEDVYLGRDRSPIDELRRTVNTQTYTPEQAAQNRQNTLMELLYASPLGNALSARDAMEAKWRGQELEAAGDAEGARQAYAEAAANAGMAFLPGMGRIGLGRNAATAAQAGQDSLHAIPAWHGSPHDFDQFKLDKIGTGEGAQAYGHGLYFAESPTVAKSYQALSKDVVPPYKDIVAREFPDIAAISDDAAKQLYMKSIHTAGTAKEAATLVQSNTPAFAKIPRERLAAALERLRDAKKGRLYRTELDVEPEDLLDWDKPLSQQSEKVKAAIGNLPEGKALFDQEALVRQLQSRLDELKMQRMTPEVNAEAGPLSQRLLQERRKLEQLESQFEDYKTLTGSPAASQALRAAGIPGIRYLDQGSRGAGEGTSNYVIFDHDLVKILGKE